MRSGAPVSLVVGWVCPHGRWSTCWRHWAPRCRGRRAAPAPPEGTARRGEPVGGARRDLPAGLDALTGYFELIWSQAVPLELAATWAATNGSPLPPEDQTPLTLVLAGPTVSSGRGHDRADVRTVAVAVVHLLAVDEAPGGGDPVGQVGYRCPARRPSRRTRRTPPARPPARRGPGRRTSSRRARPSRVRRRGQRKHAESPSRRRVIRASRTGRGRSTWTRKRWSSPPASAILRP